MSQFPHDEFIKEYFPELYQNYGSVIPSADVSSERREIDVLFVPTKPVPTTPETLGILGKIAQTTCLIEVYRNPVKSEQIRDCIGKLISYQQTQIKELKREKKKINQTESAFLWIITPTISPRILQEFNAIFRENWDAGIYFLPVGLSTGIIAIHQLPINQNTLWLRILGRGKQQIKAIEELKALPVGYPQREIILELIYGLLQKLEVNQRKKQGIIREDETLIMSLRQLYRDKIAEIEAQSRQRGLEQGIQQGIQQGEIKGKLETVPLLIQLGMKPEEIATRLELPIESVINAANIEQN